jgi:hypothetical protein
MMRQIGQNHRPPRQQRRLPQHLLRSRPRHRQIRKHLMQPRRPPQLRQLLINNPSVNSLGDRNEGYFVTENDQR